MTDLETILSWFQTGDMPTEEEFQETFSSFRLKNTKIPIAEVDKLESLLNSKINSNDYIKDGKIRADKIEALGLTELIEASEKDISEFAENSEKYEFQQNDFIAIPNEDGNFSLYLFKGGEKKDKGNYLPMGVSNGGEPLFLASPAYTITQANINNWDAPETDPVFTASPAHSITQADIDLWNQGGGGTGNYVPMAGMNVQAGERMKEPFLLGNYDIFTEAPPADSIIVGMGHYVGGLYYTGTSGGQFTGSFNAGPYLIQSDTQLNNANENYFATSGITPSSTNTSVTGSSPDGNYSATSQFISNVNALSKISEIKMTNSYFDNSTGISAYHEFLIDKDGYHFINLPNAQGDATYTRQLVQKNDGTIGYEPKVNLSTIDLRQVLFNGSHSNYSDSMTSNQINLSLVSGILEHSFKYTEEDGSLISEGFLILDNSQFRLETNSGDNTASFNMYKNGTIRFDVSNNYIFNSRVTLNLDHSAALNYGNDYSSRFTNRSLVDKAYVDRTISNAVGGSDGGVWNFGNNGGGAN